MTPVLPPSKSNPQRGCVYLVGAGPGDPDLLTMKGYRYLCQADVVVYDRLVDKRLLDIPGDQCELIYVGKRKHLHAKSQSDIQDILIAKARCHQRVVRLKGGDPFIFGRGGEEIAALNEAGIAAEVVPGITAATGAASSAQLPLTHRGSAGAVTFVTAHKRDGELNVNWDLVMQADQTVVFYMGFSLLEPLVKALLARGQDPQTRFSIISKATQDDERCLHSTLGQVLSEPARVQLSTPALLVMHHTPPGIIAETDTQWLSSYALACSPA